MTKLPASYLDPNVISAVQSEATNSGNDYKCIVTLFFFGGMDTHNVLVPTGSNPNLSIYEDIRSTGTRMEQDEIIPLGPDATWGVHKNMSVLSDLWNDNDLAFIHDVGTLNETTTRLQYESDKESFAPFGSFAHNKQQDLWQSGVENRGFLGTGWFGRTSSLFDPTGQDHIFNVGQTVDSGTISVSGAERQSTPYDNINKVNFPPFLLEELNRKGIVSDNNLRSAEEDMRHSGSTPPPLGTNELLNSSIYIINNSISSQEDVKTNTFTWEDDSDLSQAQKDELNLIFSSRKNLLESSGKYIDIALNIAKVIYSSKSDGYNQRRQTIFSGFGGWDDHRTLRLKQDPRLLAVNYTIEALVTFLKHPAVDLYDSVVICHGSDFSRTLRGNSNDGTDHAWASHSFIFGGPVNGGFYPTNYMPNYDIDGPKNEGSSLGRYIPEVAIDQMYAKLLNWFGVPSEYLHLVLPGLPNFIDSDNLDFTFASGNYTLNFI